MKSLHIFSFTFVILGAINWGLIGLFNINLITRVLTGYPMIEQLVYMLLGAAALYLIGTHKASCKVCSKK